MPYTDRTLTCVECGTEFIFSAEDQEYHDSRGFSDPRRCPSCRQARRDVGILVRTVGVVLQRRGAY